jgi:hypothetical protein
MRTARSRNSGEYLVPRAMGSILSQKEPSDKPGTIHASVSRSLNGRRSRLSVSCVGLWRAIERTRNVQVSVARSGPIRRNAKELGLSLVELNL